MGEAPRETRDDWHAWAMDKFGGDAYRANLAARAGREALDVGASQEAATRAALSAADAGRDKPTTAELQPAANASRGQQPSPSEPEAGAASPGSPIEVDSASKIAAHPLDLPLPPRRSSAVAGGSGLFPDQRGATVGMTEPTVSKDGRFWWDGAKWVPFPVYESPTAGPQPVPTYESQTQGPLPSQKVSHGARNAFLILGGLFLLALIYVTANYNAPNHGVPYPASLAPRKVITYSGTGDQKTEVFHASGNYRLAWVANLEPTQGSCGFIVHAEPSSGPSYSSTPLVNVVVAADEHGPTGSDNVYNLVDTDYYLDVSADACTWTITLTPQ